MEVAKARVAQRTREIKSAQDIAHAKQQRYQAEKDLRSIQRGHDLQQDAKARLADKRHAAHAAAQRRAKAEELEEILDRAVEQYRKLDTGFADDAAEDEDAAPQAAAQWRRALAAKLPAADVNDSLVAEPSATAPLRRPPVRKPPPPPAGSCVAQPASVCRDPARVGAFAPGARISTLPRWSASGTMWHHVPNAVPRAGVPKSRGNSGSGGVGVGAGAIAPEAAARDAAAKPKRPPLPFLDAAQAARWASGRESCIFGTAQPSRPSTAPGRGAARGVARGAVRGAARCAPAHSAGGAVAAEKDDKTDEVGTSAADSSVARRRQWLVDQFGEASALRMIGGDKHDDEVGDDREQPPTTVATAHKLPRRRPTEEPSAPILECCGEPFDGFCCRRHHPDDSIVCCLRHAARDRYVLRLE